MIMHGSMAPAHLHYVIFVEGFKRCNGSIQHGQGFVQVSLGIIMQQLLVSSLPDGCLVLLLAAK